MSVNRAIAPEVKAVKTMQFPVIEQITLKNEQQLYFGPCTNCGVVKITFHWKTGTYAQSMPFAARGALGLSLSGTSKYNAEQIAEGFESLGATSDWSIEFLSSEVSIKCTVEKVSAVLDWFMECYNGALFPKSELEVFTAMEASNLARKMQTPSYWSRKNMFQQIYASDSQLSSYSQPEDFLNLRSTTLSEHFKSLYSISNCNVLVSGETNQETITAIANHPMFSGKKTENSSLKSIITTKNSNKASFTKHHVPGTNQVSLSMGIVIPQFTIKEFHEVNIVNSMLGGFFGSRLMQEIREEQGLTYGIGSTIENVGPEQVWQISSSMNSDNAEKAVAAIKVILEEMHTKMSSEEELLKMKRYISGNFRAGFDGPWAAMNRQKVLLIRDYPFDFWELFLASLWEINAEKICEIAYNYLQPDSFTISLAGNIN